MSALYFSCLTIVSSGALGWLTELWLRIAARARSLPRLGDNDWLQSVLFGLPCIAFALWVPSDWIGERWSTMGRATRMITLAVLAAVASACIAASRLALHVVRAYRTGPGLPWFHWPLLASSALVAAVCCLADRRILVGLYENFHWGLAGGALACFSVVVVLAEVSLESLRPSDSRRRIRDAFLIAIAVSSAGALMGVELTDAQMAKVGPTVFFDKTVGFLRRATDFDDDGLSGMFGGTDCDNLDSSVSPTRFDFPENGIDEDCSGRDARWPAVSKRAFNVAPDRKGYDVLLVTVEALRADRLSSQGYRRKTTPNIDRIARESLVFRHAYCQSNSTFYTIPSMMAGLYVSNLSRSWDHPKLNPKSYLFRVTRDNRLMAEVLAKAGYVNAAFSIPGRLKLQGMNRGFKVFSSNPNYLKKIVQFLQRSSKPSLVWIHPSQAHEPYVKRKSFDFGDSDGDRYDSEVAYVDSQIGRLLNELRRLGKLDRTIVIVTSDHGEEFGEHGGQFHGRHLFDELIHVPLIVRIPGVAHATIDRPVEMVDLAPTLLDLLRLDNGEWEADGRNLFDAAKQPQEEGAAAVYSEHYFHRERVWMKSYRTSRWKLVSNPLSDSLALYDLVSDPGETTDVSFLHKNIVRDLREKMEARPLGRQGALFRGAGEKGGLLLLAKGLGRIQREPLLLKALDLLKQAKPSEVSIYLRRLAKRDRLPESVAWKLETMRY
ncbi:MAG: sulfatase-like hydrolase/transferase [Deltaproteobacteria bacterium]|nr:sulfatase-like hydrolase/transferase [Deltaproteobacteria bacterium]